MAENGQNHINRSSLGAGNESGPAINRSLTPQSPGISVRHTGSRRRDQRRLHGFADTFVKGILVPLLTTILMTVALTHLLKDTQEAVLALDSMEGSSEHPGSHQSYSIQPGNSSSNSKQLTTSCQRRGGFQSHFWPGLEYSLYFVLFLAVITFLVYFLIRWSCEAIIWIYMMFSAFLLTFFGTTSITEMLLCNYAPTHPLDAFGRGGKEGEVELSLMLDAVSLFLIGMNSAAVSVVVLTIMGPNLLRSCVLVLLSVILSVHITLVLPSWIIWTLLAVVAVWDVVAVMTPWGPLRLILRHYMRNDSQQNGSQATDPAAQQRHLRRQLDKMPVFVYVAREHNKARVAPLDAPLDHDVVYLQNPGYFISGLLLPYLTTGQVGQTTGVSGSDGESVIPRQESNQVNADHDQMSSKPENDCEQTMTLGMGDFVFYSVLIARASLLSWNCFCTALVAVLGGFVCTVLWMIRHNTAVPALPISVSAGLVAVGLTYTAIEPQLRVLWDTPDPIAF